MCAIEELIVRIPGNSYPIYIDKDYSALPYLVAGMGVSGKMAVITDENVAAYQLGFLQTAYGTSRIPYSEDNVIILKPGEASKNLDTVKSIYSRLIDMHLDRNSVIIAFGGGVTGDMAGFAASTFLRGIRYIQVPTTLLAQVDSSIGGKTGVDFLGIKNVIGSFYQPGFVYINVDSLKTLPEREFNAGMAEVVKHAVISGRGAFDRISGGIGLLMRKDNFQLIDTIYESCSVKAGIVSRDEKEQTGERAVLNFGHTFGHAMESISDFRMLHGECIALGMMAAFELAFRMGYPVGSDAAELNGLLKKAGLGFIPDYLLKSDPEKIIDTMFYDKKTIDGKLRFVIPEGIGNPAVVEITDRSLIKGSLEAILQGWTHLS